MYSTTGTLVSPTLIVEEAAGGVDYFSGAYPSSQYWKLSSYIAYKLEFFRVLTIFPISKI
jgi:hypothetical protein